MSVIFPAYYDLQGVPPHPYVVQMRYYCNLQRVGEVATSACPQLVSEPVATR
jgi:hypothetical protein